MPTHDTATCSSDLDWVQSTLTSFAGAIDKSLVPPGFDRYLRIAHADQGGGAGPLEGRLDRDEASALVEIFANLLSNQLWHLAVWDGYAQFTSPWTPCAGQLVTPGRRYQVLVGGLDRLIPDWYDRPFRFLREPVPNVWWPLDHSVFVHSEIDLATTYLGCSGEVADQVVASDVLDAEFVDPSSQPSM